MEQALALLPSPSTCHQVRLRTSSLGELSNHGVLDVQRYPGFLGRTEEPGKGKDPDPRQAKLDRRADEASRKRLGEAVKQHKPPLATER